jgi:holo-[acyl-carrier protein] synthase
MIIGTGIDIVKVERIRQAVERSGERFLKRVFSPIEIEYCMRLRNPYPSLAARFAAKEACVKAIPSGEFVAVADVEIINTPDGKPAINPGERLSKVFKKTSVEKSHLSLTHEKEYAVAMVILEG